MNKMPSHNAVTEQDWKNIVFSKRKPEAEGDEKRAIARQIENQREKEDQPQKKVSTIQKQNLAQLRTASGYRSQKELSAATYGKLTVSRINELESGKGNIPSGTEKQILFKLVKMKY